MSELGWFVPTATAPACPWQWKFLLGAHHDSAIADVDQDHASELVRQADDDQPALAQEGAQLQRGGDDLLQRQQPSDCEVLIEAHPAHSTRWLEGLHCAEVHCHADQDMQWFLHSLHMVVRDLSPAAKLGSAQACKRHADRHNFLGVCMLSLW